MMGIVYRSADLTADEFRAISERHWPYDSFAEFWAGFADYQHDCNLPNRWPNSDAGEAWSCGREAAMRIHWERHRCGYARDDLDGLAMHRGMQSAIERMRKAGTLPPRRERRNQAANDNNLAH
jgi:hypothetical protein